MTSRIWTSGILVMALVGLVACGGGNATVQPKADPVITAVAPDTGGVAGGTRLTITGLNFTNTEIGITEVLIAGRPATNVVVNSDREITCATPDGIPGLCDVSVTKNHGTGVMADAFTYYMGPEISAVSPDKGTRDGGVLVTIQGAHFDSHEPESTRVTFAGIPGTNVEILSDELIQVLSPVAPFEETTAVEVQNVNGEDTRNLAFTFLGHLPIVNEIQPALGAGDGGTLVTISGDVFGEFAAGDAAYSVTFGGIPATEVHRVDDQTLTCRSPLVPTVGTYDVVVTNPNGPSRNDHMFDFFAPPLQVYDVSPDVGMFDETMPVTISGYGFQRFEAGDASVMIGDMEATDVVVVDDGTITCTVPGQSRGTMDVTVSNNRGEDMLEAGYEYGWLPAWDYDIGTMLEFPDVTQSYSSELTNLKVDLPFTFPFWDETFDDMYVRSCGYVSFGGMSDSMYYSSADAHQIGLFAYSSYSYGYNANDPAGGVYLNSAGDFCTLTWNNTAWGTYSTDYVANLGAAYVQLQMHKSGAYAILWHENMDQNQTMYVSCIYVPRISYSSVNWKAEPSFDLGYAQYDYVYTSDAFAGNALVFWPDGDGGYTTEWKSLD